MSHHTLTPNDVHRCRVALGYSLRQIGDLLGYSRGYISNVERGHQPITDEFERRFSALPEPKRPKFSGLRLLDRLLGRK